MSNSSFYQSGPGALDTNNPTVIPNSFDGVMTADGGCSHFSPAERVAFAGRAAGTLQITVGNSATAADVVALSIKGPSLPGGAVAVSYTVQSGDSLTNVAQGLAQAINDNAVLQQFEVAADSYKAVATLRQNGPMSAFTSVVNTSSGGNTETLTFNNQNADTAVIGGTVQPQVWAVDLTGAATEADVNSLEFTSAGLAGSPVSVTYTTAMSDTPTLIATGLKNAINANSVLSTAGVTATSSGANITVNVPTVLSAVVANNSAGGNTEIYVPVNSTTADVITVRFSNGSFVGGHEDVSHTVAQGDTLPLIAAALNAAINADAVLEAAGITSTVASDTISVSQSGAEYATLSNVSTGTGDTTVTLSAQSGGLAGGSGLAIPMNNFNAMVNGVLLRLRYGIPEVLSPAQLSAAAASGPIK